LKGGERNSPVELHVKVKEPAGIGIGIRIIVRVHGEVNLCEGRAALLLRAIPGNLFEYELVRSPCGCPPGNNFSRKIKTKRIGQKRKYSPVRMIYSI
jgi:hypothetical protein